MSIYGTYCFIFSGHKIKHQNEHKVFLKSYIFFLNVSHLRKHAFVSASLRIATEPIMFCFCLFYFNFFHSPFDLRNYSTDSHHNFRNCVWNHVLVSVLWYHVTNIPPVRMENILRISLFLSGRATG